MVETLEIPLSESVADSSFLLVILEGDFVCLLFCVSQDFVIENLKTSNVLYYVTVNVYTDTIVLMCTGSIASQTRFA